MEIVQAHKRRGRGKKRERMEEVQEIINASGVSVPLWWLCGMMWLLSIVPGLSSFIQTHPTPQRLLLTLVALGLFVIIYTWFMWPHPLTWVARTRIQSLQALVASISLLTLLALGLSLLSNANFLWLFICVSAIAGVALPTRSVIVVIVILMVLTAFVGARGIEANWDQAVLPLVLLVRGLGLDMLGLTRLFAALQEMHAMRKELARLKVQEERERLSRDLHDLLGHALSLITLKSELARHLITENPERCAQELSEMEQVARQTLREVREAVAGYRQPRIESELEGARQLLQAAGINYQIEPIKESLPADLDAVLAWTVREGVTNIIRHSRARQCHIHLIQRATTVGVEVINDGGTRKSLESTIRRGLGLAGLQERVSVLGGCMEAGPLPEPDKECFRLYVELPIQDHMERQQLQEAKL